VRAREGGIQFNFDSLTDTITNLSGTLILIVVLVLGLTRAVTREVVPPPPPGPPGQAGGKPIAPLLRQVEQLKLQIRAVDQEVGSLEAILPELQQAVEDLRKRAPPPRSKETEDAPGRRLAGQPATFRFHTPTEVVTVLLAGTGSVSKGAQP
jgi:hypothetical protein